MDRITEGWPTSSVVFAGVVMVAIGIVNVVQPDFEHWFRSAVLHQQGRRTPSRLGLIAIRVTGGLLVAGGAALFVYAGSR